MDLKENRAMELESGIAAFETKNFAHATKLLSPIAEEGNADVSHGYYASKRLRLSG